MLPLKYQIILLIYLCAIPIIYLKKIKSATIAIITIFMCLLVIFKFQSNNTNVCELKHNECLIGSKKSTMGFLDGGCLDIWHIYHILLWIIIGQLLPNRYLLVFAISVGWEMFEHFGFKMACGYEIHFCGRYEDVVFNMLGYGIGSALTK
jgi:hypothetical protein